MAEIRFQVPDELKQDAEHLLKGMGMDIPSAVKIFLTQCINSDGLPFQPSIKQPNRFTITAMDEANNPKNLSTYDNFKDLRNELDI